MAAWRDERMGETGDLWHRALIDPTLRAVIGPVRALRVLEVACGNGYLARRFAREGAASVVGVELSRPTLAAARARERANPLGVRFVLGDASRLEGFPDAEFDLVVANMAFMDIADSGGAIRAAARVLVPGGRLVFSISHPCFDTDDRSMWVVERGIAPDGTWSDVVWRKVRGYREETKRSVPWDVPSGPPVRTDAYHRTLATYSRYLRDAGFLIRRLEEPSPLPEMIEQSPQGNYLVEIPLHLVVEAVRTSVSRSGSGRSAGSSREAARRSGSRARRPGNGSARPGSTAGS